MEGKYYSSERSIQLLISLLKQHNIRKVVASPGATNLSLVASLQQDDFFEMYSSVDERSAAYIACGLAAEAHEPVVLTCTGATASRNYVPGLTEAYYRQLPILAVTSTQDENRIGHYIPQVIDRSVLQNDIALLSEHIPATRDDNDEWSNTVKINRALLELRHHGGGPVHINLTTTYSCDYSVKELPKARMIRRTCAGESFPELPEGRIAVYIGSHVRMSEEETRLIDQFCATYNAVVFCNHIGCYEGAYKVPFTLVTMQEKNTSNLSFVDLLIHIGNVSEGMIRLMPKKVWRVNPDGELRDTFKRLTHVFEMPESMFFAHYAKEGVSRKTDYLEQCKQEIHAINAKVNPDELPFSNVWLASQTAHRMPAGSVLHLGILNSLRTWDMFETPATVLGYSNTGGFGIDGGVSTMIGASLASPEKLFFGVFGDLAFFYDMNVLGNRHVGNNVRILLVNNGKGCEFRNYSHLGAAFGDEADKYIAAGGHYGNKSHALVRHYAEDLGYEYLSADNKEEYLKVVDRFLTAEHTDRPMLLEVFTNNEDESDALKYMYNLMVSAKGLLANAARQMLSNESKQKLKQIILNRK